MGNAEVLDEIKRTRKKEGDSSNEKRIYSGYGEVIKEIVNWKM